MVNLARLKREVRERNCEFSWHAYLRCRQRHYSSSEVITAILNGEVIEDYPDDFPYLSCLICGFTPSERPVHIVVALAPEGVAPAVTIVTVYDPKEEN
ncbi:MAG: DUF4258 domain-containing protein [Anaerolineae bacterium]